MVNPPDKTRPKCQIPANNIEPTLDIGCTPNNHVVEQGMNSVQIPREAQKTIEARKSKDGDEGEEDDVESILSLTLDPSAFRAPEEDDEDTPPSLNLGSGLGLDLKDVTMNNSSTVISSQHKNQHEQDPNEQVYRSHNSVIHILANLSFLPFRLSTPSTLTSSPVQAPHSFTPNADMNTDTNMHDVKTTPRYKLPNRRPTGWISSFGQMGIGMGTTMGGRIFFLPPPGLQILPNVIPQTRD
ncbi:hypothetical protein I314_04495 [Cryptococcus bacillisporus CA1873]|uniref:Uncharacterized protein n=1 Tax=Cryptococcus bacillisporus CA1873 TaxID=1296111 RepID=A0ABR5B7Z3_CRYGA|nr:hypothetical protein I314_04495 [Cryptococcus bacillisporus CA1873]|eukprot:KIR59509.1 hypothetical protein I314_04495 [Cryptococcus gattii CA1873]